MTDKIKKMTPEWLTAGVAFVYYMIMALYKLTDAPLWQDEAMDFYFAIAGKGRIESIGDYANSYERLIGLGYQPPLYSFILSLWFRISEAEWWLRFSGVLFGLAAVVGIYFCIRKLCGRYMAAASVIIYASIYIMMYYVKEMAEYIMVIAVMSWGMYLYLKLFEEMTAKRIVFFSVFCVVALYTQYGAVFAVIPMALGVLISLWRSKEFGRLRACIISYGIAGVAGGVPLICFYFLPQSDGIYSGFTGEKEIIIEGGNIISDFIFSMMSILRWFLIDFDRDVGKFTVLSYLLLLAVVILSVYVVRKTKKRSIKVLCYLNAATLLFYYVMVKFNVYAYGWYGNRYQLFLFPMMFIYIVGLVYEFALILKESPKRRLSMGSRMVVQPVLIVSAVLYCMYGVHRIDNHWDKMDLRGIVDKWYELDARNMPTYLDYNQRYSFTYYLTHNEQYDESDWDNIVVNTDLDPALAVSAEQWKDYLLDKYGDDLPDTLYLITNARTTSLTRAFEDLGYEIAPVVDYTAKMYLLTAM